MVFKNASVEFSLSIVCVSLIVSLYYLVPDNDFGISVFFFALVCFSLCINDFKLIFGEQVIFSANLTPLYIWVLWFLFIHDRYGNSEEGSMVLWVKSMLMVLLTPVSHAKSVRANFILNVVIFIITSLLFVVPVYTPKLTMELSVKEIIVAAASLSLKTVIYLIVFIIANVRNGKQIIVTMNNSLWVLGSSVWFIPVAFLQIGVYLFQHSNSTVVSHILPMTKSTPQESSKKRRGQGTSSSVRHALQTQNLSEKNQDVGHLVAAFRQNYLSGNH